MTALLTIGHRLSFTPTNGHRFTALAIFPDGHPSKY